MLNAIIVDDEAPARSELRFLLDEVGGVEVTAEAANVREAIEKLKEYPCDVMFMDVNMPEATGLQLAEALQHLKFPPAVVFVTAYSEHALDAFKVSAIDYLVKPVETERLAQAIARVREQVALHLQAHKTERIPVEKGGKKILIGIDKIRFVMARDDYAYLQIQGQTDCQSAAGQLIVLRSVTAHRSACCADRTKRRPCKSWTENRRSGRICFGSCLRIGFRHGKRN